MKKLSSFMAAMSLTACGQAFAQPVRLPKLLSLIGCFAAAVPEAAKIVVVVEPIDSEATGDRYQTGLPQPLLTQHVVHTLHKLGFMPIISKRGNTDHFKGELQPKYVVRGSITGFDALTSRERTSKDGGIGAGDGRGAFSLHGGQETTSSKGVVSVVIHIESLQPHDGAHVYKVTSSESADAEFSMALVNKQLAGSVLLGIGGGYTNERMNVVDVQSAARLASGYAVVMAFANQMKLNSGTCLG